MTNTETTFPLPPVEDRLDPALIRALAAGVTGDGPGPDLFALAVCVAVVAIEDEVGPSPSAPARARALDSFLAELRETLAADFLEL